MIILLGVSVVAFLVSLFMDSTSSSEMSRKQEMRQNSLLLGPSSLIVGILLALSYKKPALVELLWPVMFTCLALISAVVNMSEISGGAYTSVMRQ